MKEKLEKLQEVIGYRFKDPGLLTHALTHSSYANEKHWDKTRCNERLEFLGDAVLEVISSDFLFHTYESMPEGEMTKLRASLVCEPTLAYCAEVIPLGDYLLLGKGEDLTGGRKRPSVVSDAMEAVIGAIYKETLVYELIKEEGPDHNKSFEVCVKIGDEEIGRGLGRTKKAAEQVAAYHGICRIK